MKLAFCLIHYFPFGGMQRDFKRITEACLKRGHTVDIYTSSWIGEEIKGARITRISSKYFTNHHRYHYFSKKLTKILNNKHYDRVIGFNKLPQLDYYFASDGCFLKHMHTKNWLLRLTQRYRIYKKYENEVFGTHSKTKIFALSTIEKENYHRYYQTPDERFHLLPPEVNSAPILSINPKKARAHICNHHQISENNIILLMVASRFKTKGLDRALIALSQLPAIQKKRAQLLIIGDDKPKRYLKRARQLNIDTQLTFIGGSDHVPEYLNAADILIHPAYRENTGLVLLESIMAGLPVLTTDQCGYASFIKQAKSGIVLPSPFDEHQMNQCLLELFDTQYRKKLANNALHFRDHIKDLKMVPKVLKIIEERTA